MSPWFHERAVVVRIALEAVSSVFEHAGWAGKHGRSATRGIDPLRQHDWKRNFSVAAENLRSVWLRYGVGAFSENSKCVLGECRSGQLLRGTVRDRTCCSAATV